MLKPVLVKCPSNDATGAPIPDVTLQLAPSTRVADVKGVVSRWPGRPRREKIRVIWSGRLCDDNELVVPQHLPQSEEATTIATLHVSIPPDAWTEVKPVVPASSPVQPDPHSHATTPPFSRTLLAAHNPAAQSRPPHSTMGSTNFPPNPSFGLIFTNALPHNVAAAAAQVAVSICSWYPPDQVRQRIAASIFLWEHRAADIWGIINTLVPNHTPSDDTRPLTAAPLAPVPWYWYSIASTDVPKNPAQSVLKASEDIDFLLQLPKHSFSTSDIGHLTSPSFNWDILPDGRSSYRIQLGDYVLEISRSSQSKMWNKLQPRLAYLEWVTTSRLAPLRAALMAATNADHLGPASITGNQESWFWTSRLFPSLNSSSLTSRAINSLAWEQLHSTPLSVRNPQASAENERDREDELPHPYETWPVRADATPGMAAQAPVVNAQQLIMERQALARAATTFRAIRFHGTIMMVVSWRAMLRVLKIAFALFMLGVMPSPNLVFRTQSGRTSMSAKEQKDRYFALALLSVSTIYVIFMVFWDYVQLCHRVYPRRGAPGDMNENANNNRPDQPPAGANDENQHALPPPFAYFRDALSLSRWAQWVGSWGLEGEQTRLNLPVPPSPPHEEASRFLPDWMSASLNNDSPGTISELNLNIPTSPVPPPDPLWTLQSLAASFVASLWPAADASRRAALRSREEATRSSVRAWASFARAALRQAREEKQDEEGHDENPNMLTRRRAVGLEGQGDEDVTLPAASSSTASQVRGRSDESSSTSSPSSSPAHILEDEQPDFDGWPAHFPLTLAPLGLCTPYVFRVAGDILHRQRRMENRAAEETG